MSLSRRQFLRLSCCSAAAAGFVAGFSRFGAINAYAQSASDYKALVCVFLFGGNDSNNLFVPFDNAGYQNYANLRTALALPQGQLLPVQTATGNVPFALHPQLTGMQTLFNNKKMAVLANVGSLVRPLTRAQYLAGTSVVPQNLFSHSDQQTQWQTLDTNGMGETGWGGRAADAVAAQNQPSQFPTITSVAGNNIFATGVTTRPATIIPGQTSGFNGLTGSAIADARNTAMQELLTFDSGISLVHDASQITGRAFADSALLKSALASAPTLQTVFPNTGLGDQLKQVARMIQARDGLGMKRQIFFCSQGGFDTHTNLISAQNGLYGELNGAISALHDATVEMGVESQVTSFTHSEFGRTMRQASGNGSDHAWGSHHMVIGGAVKGGDLYGTFPTQALAGPDDAGSEGRWIPTSSLDQYAATLATWFGVPPSALPTIFPNLANFPTTNLGFMG